MIGCWKILWITAKMGQRFFEFKVVFCFFLLECFFFFFCQSQVNPGQRYIFQFIEAFKEWPPRFGSALMCGQTVFEGLRPCTLFPPLWSLLQKRLFTVCVLAQPRCQPPRFQLMTPPGVEDDYWGDAAPLNASQPQRFFVFFFFHETTAHSSVMLTF